MKRNFPKLIALSLIFSLSVTPIANARAIQISKQKIRSMCKLMSRTECSY